MELEVVANIKFDKKNVVQTYFGEISAQALSVEFNSAQPIGGLG